MTNFWPPDSGPPIDLGDVFDTAAAGAVRRKGVFVLAVREPICDEEFEKLVEHKRPKDGRTYLVVRAVRE
ncbi:MAG: hypothetical protein EXR93_11870 [Gemmatimonadetes bacterium]|nr:hypothetical protein [Gemmatimonadota bacterium]